MYVMNSCKNSTVIGPTFHRSSNNLYRSGEEVRTVSQREALLNCIALLQTKDTSALVGHYSSMFDVPILVHNLKTFWHFTTRQLAGYQKGSSWTQNRKKRYHTNINNLL